MKTLRLFLIFLVLEFSYPMRLQSQVATNALTQPEKHKRLLTESEADEVRSHNLDPTGMTIDDYPPILRAPTPEELKQLDREGVDIAKLPPKLQFSDPREVAAMKQLISKAEKAATPTPTDLKKAGIWMDNFMGMTNATIMADVISIKTEHLKFQLYGHTYDYSGHYTIMLNTPRQHKNPLLGFGTPSTAKLLILEDFGGDSLPLQNVTIWEKSSGFIDVTALDKEWVYSGPYTIQN
jgi:hypothetical protein